MAESVPTRVTCVEVVLLIPYLRSYFLKINKAEDKTEKTNLEHGSLIQVATYTKKNIHTLARLNVDIYIYCTTVEGFSMKMGDTISRTALERPHLYFS